MKRLFTAATLLAIVCSIALAGDAAPQRSPAQPTPQTIQKSWLDRARTYFNLKPGTGTNSNKARGPITMVYTPDYDPNDPSGNGGHGQPPPVPCPPSPNARHDLGTAACRNANTPGCSSECW